MSTDTSTIHDIGYRHYEGERLGRRHAAMTLFLDGFKGCFGFGRSTRAKVAPLLLLAASCLPALIMIVIMIFTGTDELTGGYLEYLEYVQLLVSIFIAVVAPALVSRDLRSNILTLYFSRPIHRVDYIAAKFLAAVSAMFLFMATPLTVLFAGSLLAKMSLGSQLPDYLRSLVAALVLALLLSSIGILVAALAPRRGMGIAAIITVLVVSTGVFGTVQAIASETGHDSLETYAALLSPYSLVDSLSASILGAEQTSVSLDGNLQTTIFALAALAMVAAALALISLRYRRVKVS